MKKQKFPIINFQSIINEQLNNFSAQVGSAQVGSALGGQAKSIRQINAKRHRISLGRAFDTENNPANIKEH